MTAIHCSGGSAPPLRQRGVALIVALVLLVVISLMGLAGMQGTALQERMSGNMYDRSLAMQAAEAALRAAEFAISADPNVGIDCTPGSGNLCTPFPANAFNGTNAEWTDALGDFAVNNDIMLGAPQYHIQIIGDGAIANPFGQTNSANTRQYGSGAGAPVARHYRVTVRSHDPTTNGSANRAVVVLQTTVVRAL